MSIVLISSCQKDDGIKVYRHNLAKAGFERSQDKELVLYKDADGWYAVTPQTMEYILNRLDQCRIRGLPEPLEEEEIETYLAEEVGRR